MENVEQQYNLWADPHSGGITGLTANPKNDMQEELLIRYEDAIAWAGRPDVSTLVGDGWDGKDEKGADVDEDCMIKQAEDCAELTVMQKPKQEAILLTGTRYHDSHKGQEFNEAYVRHVKYLMLYKFGIKDFKVSVRRKLKTTINNWFVLEARHFIGGSNVFHGRATVPMRAQSWNILNAALTAFRKKEVPQWPNLLVYAHRHYYLAVENAWGDAMVLPCWQALGGKFGDEACDGHVDLGIVQLKVGAKEEDGWQRRKKLYSAGVVQRMEHR